jgi:hypothetical protein
MSDDAFFRARSRVRQAREAMRQAAPEGDDGPEVSIVYDLLEDLAHDLARRTVGQEDAAFHFVVRRMGELVAKHSDEAYEPYGLKPPFRMGPPAVPAWKWPVIETADSTGGPFRSVFSPFSALKMFGYTVGKKDGWPQYRREAFLSDFMRMALPPIVAATFGSEYGAPMTTTRLRKVANLIATNASNFYRNDPRRYQVAIADWESDLAYLKREFYLGAGLSFQPWPASTA